MRSDLPVLIPASILAVYLLLIRVNYVIARNKRRDAKLAMWTSVIPGLAIWILIVLAFLPSLERDEELVPTKYKVGRVEVIALYSLITAIIVASFVLLVSFQQADETGISFGKLSYRKTVMPKLEFSWQLDENKPNFGIVLENKGLHPVIVRSFQIYVDNELIDGGPDASWELAFEKLQIDTSISNHLTRWISTPDASISAD